MKKENGWRIDSNNLEGSRESKAEFAQNGGGDETEGCELAAEGIITKEEKETGKDDKRAGGEEVIPKEKTDSGEQSFSKEKLMQSPRYRNRRDLLNALLSDGAIYSIAQTEEIIENYMKGKVM